MKKLNKLHLSFSAALLTAVVSSSVVYAGTATSNLTVSSSVSANCSITTTPLSFGEYDPVVANASANLDSTGTVSVTCTDGASATIALGQGSNADAGSTDGAPLRRMSDGGTNYLSYNLYSDSARTTAWTNDAAGDVATTGTGTADEHTIYGRVTAGQNVPAGSYNDTVIATVTF